MNGMLGIHKNRRERLIAACPDGAILVRGQGPDGVNPDFYYLTGLAEPRGVLLMSADGIRIETGRQFPGPNYVHGTRVRQILFLPGSDPLLARWGEDGVASTATLQADAAGVDRVLDASTMGPILARALQESSTLHVVRGWPVLSTDGEDDPDSEFVARIRRRLFDLQVRDATPLVHEMRRSKDADELARIRAGIDLVAEALDEVMRTVRAGQREYEIEALLARVYRAHGGSWAFDPIVASGINATRLHYTANNGTIAAGDLLLIDTGVRLEGYCCDITRTIPVDGRFTERQREIYEIVLRTEQESIAACRPGLSLGDLHALAHQRIAAAGHAQHFPHGTGHHLGIETHDAGDVHAPLIAGAVITVEPGIYIEDESLGIRIEDDVWITDDGPVNLSEKIPTDAAAIEERMRGMTR